MSLDFPKRSDRKILERIIPPPSGGRDKLLYADSSYVPANYVGGIVPLTLRSSFLSLSASVTIFVDPLQQTIDGVTLLRAIRASSSISDLS